MSNDVYLISDTHFSHRNILNWSRTQFKTYEEHDDYLIERWNNTVNPTDTVIHLGDVCFQKALRYDYVMSKLNGIKRLVMGNHDDLNHDRLKYFNSVHGSLIDKGDKIVYTHIPVHPSLLEHRWNYNVHGHLHSNQIDDSRYINISCENTSLTPVLKSNIIEEINNDKRTRETISRTHDS